MVDNPQKKILESKKVNIWKGNTTREFLDSIGLSHYREGECGPIYGYQWRNFDLPYRNAQHYKSYRRHRNLFKMTDLHYKDQLQNIIDSLNHPEEKHSRRLIMSAWNPNQIDKMALPPCHILSQFNVIDNKLYCNMYQRSADIGLGVPFNIASYSLLTTALLESSYHFHD